jgi:hypothetical protein
LKRSCADVGSVIAGRYRYKASFSSLHQNRQPLGQPQPDLLGRALEL